NWLLGFDLSNQGYAPPQQPPRYSLLAALAGVAVAASAATAAPKPRAPRPSDERNSRRDMRSADRSARRLSQSNMLDLLPLGLRSRHFTFALLRAVRFRLHRVRLVAAALKHEVDVIPVARQAVRRHRSLLVDQKREWRGKHLVALRHFPFLLE